MECDTALHTKSILLMLLRYVQEFLFGEERKEYISSEGVTSNQLDKYLNEIPKEWERIQATIYQDEMDNSLEDKPLILQADSWRRFREHSFLIPNSLRSVDQSARGEIITLPFED